MSTTTFGHKNSAVVCEVRVFCSFAAGMTKPIPPIQGARNFTPKGPPTLVILDVPGKKCSGAWPYLFQTTPRPKSIETKCRHHTNYLSLNNVPSDLALKNQNHRAARESMKTVNTLLQQPLCAWMTNSTHQKTDKQSTATVHTTTS